MKCSIMELLEKSVINSATGEKIGNLCDVELNTEDACLSALIVAIKSKSGSFLAKTEKVRIEWCNIKVIGHDAVLVNCQGELKYLEAEKSFIEKLWN